MDCLVLIFRALGTPTDAACPALTRLPHFHTAFPSWPPRPPSSLVRPGAGEAVRGLLDGMLRLDPGRRVSARAALHSLPDPSPLDALPASASTIPGRTADSASQAVPDHGGSPGSQHGPTSEADDNDAVAVVEAVRIMEGSGIDSAKTTRLTPLVLALPIELQRLLGDAWDPAAGRFVAPPADWRAAARALKEGGRALALFRRVGAGGGGGVCALCGAIPGAGHALGVGLAAGSTAGGGAQTELAPPAAERPDGQGGPAGPAGPGDQPPGAGGAAEPDTLVIHAGPGQPVIDQPEPRRQGARRRRRRPHPLVLAQRLRSAGPARPLARGHPVPRARFGRPGGPLARARQLAAACSLGVRRAGGR